MAVEIIMPKISDHMDVGVIVNWLSKEGEGVERGQPILVVDTDQAAAELKAPESGYLRGIRAGVEAGANIPVGETIAFIANTLDEYLPPLAPLNGDAAQYIVEIPAEPAQASEQSVIGDSVRAAPAVRRIARELGIDIRAVRGSGPVGRVLEVDLYNYVQAHTPDSPQPVITPVESPSTMLVERREEQELGMVLTLVTPDSSPEATREADAQANIELATPVKPIALTRGESEELALSHAHLLTGHPNVESGQIPPQYGLMARVDMTRSLDLCEALTASIEAETGARLSVLAILVRIVADALKRYPRANATFVDGRLELHQQVNIGVAIEVDDGLVVPVIHEADKKSLSEISQELKTFQDKAVRSDFDSNDLSGRTLTIFNLGIFEIDHFIATISPPESAILAVGQISKMPVGMTGDSIALRPMLSMTLSVDQRSLDGMQAAKFLMLVKERLEQPYLLL